MASDKNFWCLATKLSSWIPFLDQVRIVVRMEARSKPLRTYPVSAKGREEAWLYCQQLAREAGGTAYLQNLAGRVEREVSFQDS